MASANKGKKIILHIGMQKAGSKALQTAAKSSDNAELCFPKSGRDSPFWHRQVFYDEAPDACREAIDEVPPSRIGLISFERGYLCSDERIGDFGRSDASLYGLLLVRDPLPWLHSFRNQAIKSRNTSLKDIENVFRNVQFCINSFQFSEFCPKWSAVCDELSIVKYDEIGDVVRWFNSFYFEGRDILQSFSQHGVNLALNPEGVKTFTHLKAMQLDTDLQVEVCRILQRDFRNILFEKENKFRFYSKRDAEDVKEALLGEADYLDREFGVHLGLWGWGGDYWSLDRLLNEPLSEEASDALQKSLDVAREVTGEVTGP
jgi:hypothetical protein